MKKFAKGCLIAALSMFGIGIIIIALCTFAGGTTLYTYAKNYFSWSDIFDGHVIKPHNVETHIDFSNNQPTYSGDHEDMQVASTSDVISLDLEIAGGACEISESTDDYFHIYSENAEEFQYYVEDETLYIKGFNDIAFNTHSNNHNYIYLEIPKDFVFKNIELKLGAGVIEAASLLASNEIELEIGAGELIVDSLSANTLTTEVGAGNAELNNASVKDSTIEIDLGNMTYLGLITGNLTAECGMGNLSLYLDDEYESHNYNVELVMGNMTLNKKSFRAVALTDNIHHGTTSTYVLECGMGNMTVLFE